MIIFGGDITFIEGHCGFIQINGKVWNKLVCNLDLIRAT